jgi:endo-1,4-beta-mannosidase
LGTEFTVEYSEGKTVPFRIAGINYWQAMNVERSILISELEFLKARGINTITAIRMRPSLMTSPVYNQTIFKNLDFVLYKCSQLDIRIIMVLGNFWHWSGGKTFAQYLSWSRGTPINYPTRDPKMSLLEKDTESTESFYTDEKCKTWFLQHISAMMNRFNTFTNTSYKTDTVVLHSQ